jgi:hypothetical protein
MADTVTVSVAKGVWTEIAEGPLTDCLVTPTKDVYFAYAASDPTFESGHSLWQFENHNAVPEDGESFWILSPQDACLVYKTERAEA